MKPLRRYTTIPVLLDMLMRKKLVLLDPKTWEDKNDSATILVYKKRKKVKNSSRSAFHKMMKQFIIGSLSLME